MADLSDDFRYIKEIMQGAEEDIEIAVEDRGDDFTEQESELLYIVGEIENLADSALALLKS